MERPWNGWSTLQMNSTALAGSAVEVADMLFLHFHLRMSAQGPTANFCADAITVRLCEEQRTTSPRCEHFGAGDPIRTNRPRRNFATASAIAVHPSGDFRHAFLRARLVPIAAW
jgi:hypothetical protein